MISIRITLARKASRGGMGLRLSGPPQSQAAAPTRAAVQAHPLDRKVADRAGVGKHSLYRILLQAAEERGKGLLLMVVYIFCLVPTMTRRTLNHLIPWISCWSSHAGAYSAS